MNVRSFFIMDENFLLNRPRAMQLLERMKQAGKSWSLYVFSSVNAIRKYTMEELVQLGISWIWLGLESPNSTYAKLQEFRYAGAGGGTARSTASSCWARPSSAWSTTRQRTSSRKSSTRSRTAPTSTSSCCTRRCPGRRCYQQMQQEGRMLDGVDLADIHGQFKFNFKHAAISRDESKQFLDWAFRHDFERNGPSLFRICETIFQGWKRYHNHPDLRVRRRFAQEATKLRTTYNAALWAMEKRLRTTNPPYRETYW